MTSMLIALLLLGLVAAAITVARQLTDNDGGPRHRPMEPMADHWHPSLPSHPYRTQH
jgi:hypothetical protein